MKPVAIALIILGIAGCQARTQVVERDTFDPAKIAYFKDARTDLCFGVIAYARWDTRGTISYGQSVTAVPCSSKVEQLATAQ